MVIGSVVFALGAALLTYAETRCFVWDEGFHILAAQLIAHGKLPYRDFCFPQTPLNAYFNAFLMRLFGESWHVTHACAGLFLFAVLYMVADFVYERFPFTRWRVACAITAAVMVAANVALVQFGPISQAYAIGTFCCVAGFRAAIACSRLPIVFGLIAGIVAGAGTGSTLLMAPTIPVLLVWLWLQNFQGKRIAISFAFCAGVLVSLAPIIYLFAVAPRQTFFNVIQYQALFRRVNWGDPTGHDVDVLSAWLDDGQILALFALFIAGMFLLVKTKRLPGRAEFGLAASLALALSAYIAIAHPTFSRYFIFAVPFAAIIGVLGLYDIGSRLATPSRPIIPASVVCALMLLVLGRRMFNDRDSMTWHDYQQMARKIEHVTPSNAKMYVDELVYFLTKRPPPPGMEFSYSHKLDLPQREEKLLHIISAKEVKQQIAAGQFYTVETCKDEVEDDFDLDNLFPNKATIKDCDIYWGPVKADKTYKSK